MDQTAESDKVIGSTLTANVETWISTDTHNIYPVLELITTCSILMVTLFIIIFSHWSDIACNTNSTITNFHGSYLWKSTEELCWHTLTEEDNICEIMRKVTLLLICFNLNKRQTVIKLKIIPTKYTYILNFYSTGWEEH